MRRKCCALGCAFMVPASLFMCKKHWFSLSADLRARVWRSYRQGQENDGLVSEEYRQVAQEAILWLYNREHRRECQTIQEARVEAERVASGRVRPGENPGLFDNQEGGGR